MTNHPIDIRPAELEQVCFILKSILPLDAKVSVFGSRIKGRTTRGSDLDLMIDVGRALNKQENNQLFNAFEDSDLPYKVDIVDYHMVSDSFKKMIQNEQAPLIYSKIQK